VIYLLNDSTEVRQRSSDGVVVLDCGCAHTDIRWLQMCDAHFQPDHQRHTQALQGHAAQDLIS
jgi:hypothetical protein